MRKIYIVLFILLALTGCNLESLILEEDKDLTEDEVSFQNSIENGDPLKNYPNIDETLKPQLQELYRLWKEFDNSKDQDIDPTEDFHNSEYKAALKNFLSQRESLAVSDNDLVWILEQPGYDAMDKTIFLSSGKEFNIRVISYHVNYYVQAITDFVGLPNNLIFVQCWNDDEFYFTVISDGDIHTVHDFFPLEINGVFHIILTGTSFPYYPQPPFLWAWHLEADGFKQSSLFDFKTIETDEYFIYDSLDFDNNHSLLKWTFQTDGAFIALEKCELPEGDSWPDYFNVVCETKDEGRMFIFTSYGNLGEIDSTILIKLADSRYVIE